MVKSTTLVSLSTFIAATTLVLGIPVPEPPVASRWDEGQSQEALVSGPRRDPPPAKDGEEGYKDDAQLYPSPAFSSSSLLSEVHSPIPTTVLLQLDSEDEDARKSALSSRTDPQPQTEHLNSKKDIPESESARESRLFSLISSRFSSSSSSTTTTADSSHSYSTAKYKKMPTTYGPLAVIRSLDFETLIIWTSYRPVWAWSIIASMLLLLFIVSVVLFELVGFAMQVWRRMSRLTCNAPVTGNGNGGDGTESGFWSRKWREGRHSPTGEKRMGVD